MPPGLFLFFNFSLPTQRCCQRAGRVGSLGVLFSAYAEVFPFYSQSKRAPPPFLCLRRGVSYAEEGATLEWVFSLPTQRCFRYEGETRPAPDLFSAYAEVFLKRALDDVTTANFSLPTQRCFRSYADYLEAEKLFSAYAEVFPGARPPDPERTPFLCLRRGVSR